MTPRETYTQQLAACAARAERLVRACQRLGVVRLVLAAVILVCAWFAWHVHWLSPWWLLLPAVAFAAVLAWHARLRKCRMRAERSADFYRRGLARLDERWAGGGNRGERFADPQHVYAADLDLFGEGSLYELLCAARTAMGEETLARWLLAPAPVTEIRERQVAVRELGARLDFRERVAVLGRAGPPRAKPEGLEAWAASPERLGKAWIRSLAWLLPACFLAALAAGFLSSLWLVLWIVLIAEIAVLFLVKARVQAVLSPLETAFDRDDLQTFAALLQEIERADSTSAALRALAQELGAGGERASTHIRRLATVVAYSENRKNLMVMWAQLPLLYGVHVALAAERWRRASGAQVRAWLGVAGRFEALASLAQYSFEHPDGAFPEILAGPACLRAQALGHPLLPRAVCVRNDVDLCAPARVWLVSGSNMSGKSTLLRALGLNVVLAMAGAPVCAAKLELTPLQVGASIRVNDSLREGASRFYAEIKRLRELVQLAAQAPPLLFLIDEILQGTNSYDRRLGAQGVLRVFAELGAIGLVTTHDLALTAIQGLGEGVLCNLHFEDHLENGQLRFDFKLRPGVVTRSNGLELMRAMGLEV
ncbi:MAG: MutS-related protein [Gammaproteobacteria bacterium]